MYSTILVPVDLEHDASWNKALPTAQMIAESTGADIHLLTIVPDVRSMMVAQYFPADYEEKAVRDAAVRLKALANEQMPGRDVGIHVEDGSIYRNICDTADRLGCDLIVMASHRPELTDILIGPNADQVVRHTKASVMVVRS